MGLDRLLPEHYPQPMRMEQAGLYSQPEDYKPVTSPTSVMTSYAEQHMTSRLASHLERNE